MIIHINAVIIKTVVVSIIVNNVVSIENTEIEISSEDDQLYSLDDEKEEIEIFESPYHLKKSILRQKDEENQEDIKALLEEKYKFRNDERSTRFKVAREERSFPDFNLDQRRDIELSSTQTLFPDTSDDRNLAWAFRTYAVRRIVGGMETTISMYPYNVAIAKNAKHWCGGSVIDEQWVLTAGHCLESAFDGDKNKLRPYIIRAGSSFHNRGGYQARVNKVFFPRKYVPGNADYDYSLLRLDRPMPIGKNIAVLNLPSKDYKMKENDIIIVTGWGSTDESGTGHIPDRLRFVPVPVMTLDECQNSYRFYITPRMLCAGYATGGKDACNHDSGGPAVRDGVLLGLVSFGGKQCGDPRSPGVYSRVSEVTDWVENTITHNEAFTVPELKPKISKARQREKELQKFKSRVEDKKNKIKSWLRETLMSPTFIELAKKKLMEAGFHTRRTEVNEDVDMNVNLDDRMMDEINLTNMINDRIIDDGEGTETDQLLRTLALHEVMVNDEESRELFPPRALSNNTDSIESFIAYVSKDRK